MKLVHVGGGLGNQIADYFNYLVVKRNNPNDEIYIETMTYDIPEMGKIVSTWNGYELEKVFGLQLPNIKSKFQNDEFQLLEKEIQDTKFWEKSWTPRVEFCKALNNHGYNFKIEGNGEIAKENSNIKEKLIGNVKTYLTTESSNVISYYFKRFIWKMKYSFNTNNSRPNFGLYTADNVYYAPTFSTIKSSLLLDEILPEFRSTLRFSNPTDNRNLSALHNITNQNSVSLHARRSDYLQYNNDCYKYGYFKRAVNYIKRYIDEPVFYIFSEDCGWCENHTDVFGLSESDNLIFVDWNTGVNSFRDLQLMANCKNNIITKSSFGYIACLLNSYPQKITISQISDYQTTIHL